MPVLRVATFNIQHGRGPDGRVDVQRLAHACASIDADILGLQEVDVGVGRSHRADLAGEVAEAAGLHASFAIAMQTDDGGEYGNALLTRQPHSHVEVVRLPAEPGREPRVALLARVAGISVAVTHLSVGADLHRRQLAAVIARLGPAPRLVMGDFNHEDPALPGLTRAESLPTWPAHAPRLRLDHIATDGLRVEAVDVVELPVSDHRALVATLSE